MKKEIFNFLLTFGKLMHLSNLLITDSKPEYRLGRLSIVNFCQNASFIEPLLPERSRRVIQFMIGNYQLQCNNIG
jgi:hypothetical protein